MNSLIRHSALNFPRASFFGPFEQIFDQLLNEVSAPSFFDRVRSNSGFPKMNISRDTTKDKDEFVISVNVAGVEPNDLKVEIEEDVVRISGRSHVETENNGTEYFVKELTQRQFSREVRLPEYVEGETTATVKNGILTLKWLVKQQKVIPKAKTISIKQE